MKLAIALACVFLMVHAQIVEPDYSGHPDCQLPACPRGEIRNKTHPLDCTKYVSCSDGSVTVRDCPSGFKFSPEVRQCEISIGGAGQGCLPCWSKRVDAGYKFPQH